MAFGPQWRSPGWDVITKRAQRAVEWMKTRKPWDTRNASREANILLQMFADVAEGELPSNAWVSAAEESEKDVSSQPAAEEDAGFEVSSGYTGAVVGKVFKKGTSGVGYYTDAAAPPDTQETGQLPQRANVDNADYKEGKSSQVRGKRCRGIEAH